MLRRPRDRPLVWLGDLNVAAAWGDVGPDPSWFREKNGQEAADANDRGQTGFTHNEQVRLLDDQSVSITLGRARQLRGSAHAPVTYVTYVTSLPRGSAHALPTPTRPLARHGRFIRAAARPRGRLVTYVTYVTWPLVAGSLPSAAE